MALPTLGIDISKRKFDAALLRDGKLRNKSCPNTREGFEELVRWMERQGAQLVHACMEATGTYGEPLASYLVARGHMVSMVNPARIKGFAQSKLSRTKTDLVDAGLIAQFCEALQPELWTPLPSEVRELQSLVRRLSDLNGMLQMEQNRLESGAASESVSGLIAQHVTQLQEQIKETKKRIARHFDDHPGLREKRDLLATIPGIGELTASILLAEIGDFSNFESARQLVAYCGLNPRERRSGSSVRGRVHLSKVGNARVRKALYMPALVAIRCNPLVKALSERMRASGKVSMVIIGAAMRKLLHLVFGVLKRERAFDAGFAQVA